MSWFGSVKTATEAARRQQGQIFTFERLTTPGAPPPAAVTANEDYLTIIVRSSYICDVRKWAGKFHAAVHARAHYLHQDQGDVEFQTLISPQMFRNIDPANLDRVITVDKDVLGPIPYVGGVSLELGLFSVGSADLMAPYLDLLSDVADAAGTGFVASVKPFAAPLRKGLNLLFGDPNRSELEIGLDISWRDMETGTWLLMRAPAGTVVPAALTLHPVSHHLQTADGRPWLEHPYVVLTIEAGRRRADFMTIPDIKHAWDTLRAAALGEDPAQVLPLLRRFETICRWSPDLVPVDATRLIDMARGKADPARVNRLAAALDIGSLGNLPLYNNV